MLYFSRKAGAFLLYCISFPHGTDFVFTLIAQFYLSFQKQQEQTDPGFRQFVTQKHSFSSILSHISENKVPILLPENP
jgi:hypothetical protein